MLKQMVNIFIRARLAIELQYYTFNHKINSINYFFIMPKVLDLFDFRQPIKKI